MRLILLFETNNHKGYKSDLPRLVFVCANNHLYPIDNPERRETIFKTCSVTGGKLNKYKTQQTFENVRLGYNETLKNYYYLICLFTHYSLKLKTINIMVKNMVLAE